MYLIVQDEEHPSILYFFPDIDLLENTQWKIFYLTTKLFLDNFFFLIELSSFELIFSSEKRPPVEYLVRAE